MRELQQIDAIWKRLHDEDHVELRVGSLVVGCREKPRAIVFGRYELQREGSRLAVLDANGQPVTDPSTVKRLLGYVRGTHDKMFGGGRPDWASARVRTDRAALDRLVETLSARLPEAKRKRLGARVALAVDDPAAYARRYAKDVEARGLEPEITNLHVFALLDGAVSAGIAREIDWRDESGPLRRAIVRIGKLLGADLDETMRIDLDGDLESVLPVLGKRLARAPVRLFLLDTRADSYAAILVSARSAARVTKLSTRARVPLKALTPASCAPTR